MSGMTREVLAFARGETNVARPQGLPAPVPRGGGRPQLEHDLAGREHRRSGSTASYNGVAYFDEQKMLRVIHNLARNAAQAMPRGGEFRISTRAEATT